MAEQGKMLKGVQSLSTGILANRDTLTEFRLQSNTGLEIFRKKIPSRHFAARRAAETGMKECRNEKYQGIALSAPFC